MANNQKKKIVIFCWHVTHIKVTIQDIRDMTETCHFNEKFTIWIAQHIVIQKNTKKNHVNWYKEW